MSAAPYSREEIEEMRLGDPPFYLTAPHSRWLATLDARDAALRRIDALFPLSTCVMGYIDGLPCDRDECIGCIARKALAAKP